MDDLREAFLDSKENMTLHEEVQPAAALPKKPIQKDTQHGPPLPRKIPVDTAASSKSGDAVKKHHSTDTPLDERQNMRSSLGDDAVDDALMGTVGGSKRLQKRHSAARDDMDVTRRSSSKHGTEMTHLHREIEHLRKRAIKAEAERDHLRMAVASYEPLEQKNEKLMKTVATLQLDEQRLQTELEDARSHIFSLQPYRKDLTPDEVKREYAVLVNNVSEWAEKFMEPILGSPETVAEIAAMAKKRSPELSKIKRVMSQHTDLINGSMFPETDVDLVIAIIMRYLHDNIFQKVLYGAIQECVQTIGYAEAAMHTHMEPKRDLFSIRSWLGEAYNALISHSGFRQERNKYTRKLTQELADTFKVFSPGGGKDDQAYYAFCFEFQNNCIVPAMRLHEKFLTSTHHFYTDMNTYIFCNQKEEMGSLPEFYDHLAGLDCDNVLHNRKKFQIERLDPQPSKLDLQENLLNVVTLVPAVYMRQVGRGGTIKEPINVSKQKMLVAWGPPEKRDKMFANAGPTLMYRIYFPKIEKSEKEKVLDSFLPVTWKWSTS